MWKGGHGKESRCKNGLHLKGSEGTKRSIEQKGKEQAERKKEKSEVKSSGTSVIRSRIRDLKDYICHAGNIPPWLKQLP